VVIFSIGLGGRVNHERHTILTQETGGYYYRADNPEALDEIYARISAGLLSEKYRLDYMSTDESTGEIRVESARGRVVGF